MSAASIRRFWPRSSRRFALEDGGDPQFEVVQLLSTVGVKMLIVDEIQHVLAGPMLKQRHFLNVIKYLGNELQIPIVAAGTHDAFNAIQTDPQLSNRFEPALLRRWTLTDEYLRLLASFEVALPSSALRVLPI